MLMSQENGKKMAQALDLPQLEVELERAIWQVETAVKKSIEEAAGKATPGEPEKSNSQEGPNPDTTKSQEDKKSQ